METEFDLMLDDFEQQLKDGKQTTIDDWLVHIPDHLRESFCRQLVAIHVYHRIRRLGELVEADEYQQYGNKACEVARVEIKRCTDEQQGTADRKRANERKIRSHILANSQEHKCIGPYTLLEQIGEGGMGSVWLARQEQPIKRRVALKLIKPDLSGKEFVARFEAERQALSMMDHRNIARVLDAGAGEQGEPYYVMELIEGVAINQYCDEHRLGIEDRLALFMPICRAIQHAHQKGIIHRDIKPSNILVTTYDGKPIPKVIDFGLAKATDHTHKLTDTTLQTEFGKIVGTLRYMSPEQAELNTQDVDTRSDVYSLGVILYELLAGSTPLDSSTLGQNAILKILELIRESEPPRPSVRLNDSSDALTDISSKRKIAPSRLLQILRGELDWIVMKALERDRKHRYESAGVIAEDIERYLAGDPVLARPPSSSYRISKFVDKNIGLVTAVCLIAVLLVGGLAGTSRGIVLANREAQHTRNAQKIAQQNAEQSRIEKLKAQKSEQRSMDVLRIFTDSFGSVDPNKGANSGMLAKEVLFRAQASLDKSNLDRLGRVQLLRCLVTTFNGVGEYEAAISASEAEVEIMKQMLGACHPATLTSLNDLAVCYNNAGRNDEANALHKDVLRLRKSILGNSHPATLISMNNLALGLYEAGKNNESIALFEMALAEGEKLLGVNHPDNLLREQNLARSYNAAGRNREAIELLKHVVNTRKNADDEINHPDTLTAMSTLAVCYSDVGQTLDAIELLKKVVAMRKIRLGDSHPNTLSSMSNLASNYGYAGRIDEAIALHETILSEIRRNPNIAPSQLISTLDNLASNYLSAGRIDESVKFNEEALELMKVHLGVKHPTRLTAMSNLAHNYLAIGQTDKAILLHKKVLSLRTAELGPEHPSTLASMNNLALSYFNARKFADAVKLNEQVFQLVRKKLGVAHPDTLVSMSSLANSYRLNGQTDEAMPLFKQVLHLREQNLGSDHPATLTSINDLAAGHVDLGNTNKAIELYQDLVKKMKSKLGADHPDTLNSMNNLAASYFFAERFDEAIKLNENVLGLMKKKFGPDHPKTLFCLKNLVAMCGQAGQSGKSVQMGEKLVQLTRNKLGPIHADTIAATHELAVSYDEAGKNDDAIQLLEELLELVQAKLGGNDATTISTRYNLGILLIASDADRAAQMLKSVYQSKNESKPEHWRTYNSQSILGEALLKSGKLEEASQHLIQSYEKLSQKASVNPVEFRSKILVEALERLIQLAEKENDKDAMKKWREKKNKLTVEVPTDPASVE